MQCRIAGFVLISTLLIALPLAGQAPRIPESAPTTGRADASAARGFAFPPDRSVARLPRHAHVRDGALIGAGLGSLAGGLMGLSRSRQLCPQRLLVCQGVVGAQYSMLVGIGIGGLLGGTTGGVVGAFVRTSDHPGRTRLGVTVEF